MPEPRKVQCVFVDSAIKEYLAKSNTLLPTKSVLAQWRDDMLAGSADAFGKVFAVRSINARPSASRKLLRAVANDTTDITVKFVSQDWAGNKTLPAVYLRHL